MVDSAFVFFMMNVTAVFMFMSCFLEYYIARYDLSEAQVTSILKKLPNFLEPIFLMRTGSVENLVKEASMPFPLVMMGLTMLMPIATIGNISIELRNNRPLLVVIYALILIGCAYAVFRFYRIFQYDDSDETP
jgi:hypothetical protein